MTKRRPMKQQRLQLLLIRLAEKKRFFLNKLAFVEQEEGTLQTLVYK